MRHVTVRLPILLLLLLVPITACTSHLASRQAEIAAQRGDWDEAVLQYMKAVEQSPESLSYKASLMRAKIKASQAHLEKGQEFEKAGVIERALVEYQQAVQLDPTNQYAQTQLEHAREAYSAQRKNGGEPATIDQMKKKTRGTRPQPPVLNPRSNQPISLEFPEAVSIFQIYKALGQAFGINILFDPNLKDQEISIELKEVTAQSALETLMRAGNHFYKVIDEHTIIIAQDTPQNRRTYEDLVIQTFFLSNSEVKDMMTILRSLVDAKKIATNEQLNAIILRDTADKVKVAERIIEANDKSKAEVVIDVELLQINSTRLRDLGVTLSAYQVQQTLDTGGTTGGGTGGTGGSTAGRVRVSDLEFLNQSNWFLTLPNFLYNFAKENSDAQLLAKPQLRITEGEKASLVIGDKVPIPLTTFNTSNTVGGNIVPITSFQYQDVGIRIDLEPRVHHNREVTLKVKVAVDQINSFRGDQPIIGTRTIESVIRLQDGETNFLAGLIRTDDSDAERGLPGLSEIPVLGRLFSNKRTDSQRTDVILTLTPHIIRNAEITEDDLLPIWVGTEANITFRGGSPRVESDVDGPFEAGEETPEEIQDAIRRRLQRLPRGLRPEDGGEIMDEGDAEVQEEQPPAGIDLAPAAPPSDIFRPQINPLDSPPPDPPDSEDEGLEEEPPGPQASAPRALLGSWRTERSAENAGITLSAAKKSPAPVQVWLMPRKLKVVPGERFVVKVQASADRPISHLPLSLSYDPGMLAVEQVERGSFPLEAEILADASRPGEVVLGASRMGEVPGVTGEGTVARITFRALPGRAGSTRIDFSRTKALDAALKPVVPVRARSIDVLVGARKEG